MNTQTMLITLADSTLQVTISHVRQNYRNTCSFFSFLFHKKKITYSPKSQHTYRKYSHPHRMHKWQEPGWIGSMYGRSHISGGRGLLPDHSNAPRTYYRPPIPQQINKWTRLWIYRTHSNKTSNQM